MTSPTKGAWGPSAIVTLLALLLLHAGPIEAAFARTASCMQTSRIRSIESVDARTARFTLWNRTIWLNTFRSACGVSGFKGFTYKTPTGQLCSGGTMRAVGTGNTSVCILGKFEEVPPPGH
ncbi:MAG TPA: hypothetical protein VMU08_18860 [Rhizomicrobium sp.]|nr:hypothetical protein [Rhizomicrobium sp.]